VSRYALPKNFEGWIWYPKGSPSSGKKIQDKGALEVNKKQLRNQLTVRLTYDQKWVKVGDYSFLN